MCNTSNEGARIIFAAVLIKTKCLNLDNHCLFLVVMLKSILILVTCYTKHYITIIKKRIINMIKYKNKY